MTKIVYLPLDERPCNRDFPAELFGHSGVHIVSPPLDSFRKHPASREKLAAFLLQECQDADGLVLSLDMLLYGGLLPSRVHHESFDDVTRHADILTQIRQERPTLPIFAFQCVMRCPAYSSSDEEPDYYEQYGEQIHKIGVLQHQWQNGSSFADYEKALSAVPDSVLADYLSRRERNLRVNLAMLDKAENGLLNLLVFPQDDSAAYGFAALDQQRLRESITERHLQKRVPVYPGADEVGLTLTARMLLHLAGKVPQVYTYYAAKEAKKLVPLYEGRPLDDTVRQQLAAAGCLAVDTDTNADILLGVTAPAAQMQEAREQPCRLPGYESDRNLPDFVKCTAAAVRAGRIVSLADNAYANGGELALVDALNQLGLLDTLAGYAGWNTSANTLGTAIAQAVDQFLYGSTPHHHLFLMKRYLEDAGYCSLVRWRVTANLPPNTNYFDITNEENSVAAAVLSGLSDFLLQRLSSAAANLELYRAWLPWHRMFEVGFELGFTKECSTTKRGSGSNEE